MTNIVSDSTASLGSRLNKSGPWYYNGAVYVVLRESPGIGIYKATYTESGGFGTFSAQDTANEPSGNTITTSEGHFSAQDPNNANLIHVINYGTESGGNHAIEYSRFDCSTDTWAETDTTAVSSFTLAAGDGSAMLVVRSDGDKVIVYQGPAEKVHGTNYGRIFYTVHQGTAWGDASGSVDGGAGSTTSYQNPTIAIDDADNTHIIFQNGSAWRHNTLNSSNSLGTEQATGGNAQLWVKPQLRYYNNGGTHEIYFSYRHTSGGAYYLPIVGGTPGTQVQMTSTSQYSQGATWETTHDLCVRASNGDLYFAFAGSSDQDDYYVTDASGSWSSDTSVSGTTQTIQDLDAEIIVTDEGATVLAVVFQDSAAGQMEIFDVTIEAGAPSIGGQGLETPAAFGSGSLEQEIAGTGLSTSTAFGTGLLEQELSGAGLNTTTAFGSGSLEQEIAGTGLSTPSAFGDGVLEQEIQGAGLETPAAFGTGTLQEAGQQINGVGLSTSTAFGSGTLEQEIAGTGLATSSTFGNGSLVLEVGGTGVVTTSGFGDGVLEQEIAGTGLETPAAFGTGTLSSGQQILGSGLETPAAFGSGTLEQEIAGTGLATSSTFGNGSLVLEVGGTGVVTTSGFGDGVLEQEIQGAGLETPAAFGTGTLSSGQQILGSGLETPAVFGSGTLEQEIAGTGVVATSGFGDGVLQQEIQGAGLETPAAFGTGELQSNIQQIQGVGLASSTAFGDGVLEQEIMGAGLVTATGFGSGTIGVFLTGDDDRGYGVEAEVRGYMVEVEGRGYDVPAEVRGYMVE